MRIDYDLQLLDTVLSHLDSEVARLMNESRVTEMGYELGYFDRCEFLSGLGFVACQWYMKAIIQRHGPEERTPLRSGPTHRTGKSIAATVNAAANLWKHSAEWPEGGDLSKKQRLTAELVESLGVDPLQEFPMVGVLAELLRPLPAELARLAPFLEHWRDSLIESGPEEGTRLV